MKDFSFIEKDGYPDWALPYLALANEFLRSHLTAANLEKSAGNLLLPTFLQVEHLAQLSNDFSKSSPKSGWVISHITYIATKKLIDAPLTKAFAAWQTIKMANEWARPDLVEASLLEAQLGFREAGQPAWLAACSWQKNALPWTRPNFAEAKAELLIAVDNLVDTELTHFVPECQLALAYAKLLTADYQGALQTLSDAESAFATRSDRFNLGRCNLTRASALRRQGLHQEVLKELEVALILFQELPAPVEIAKTQCQLGYYSLFSENNYPKAKQYFVQAQEVFTTHEMPLWQAISWHGLGQVLFESGQIVASNEALINAKDIYHTYQVVGSLGNVLFDLAKYERLAGNYNLSIQYLKNVEQLYGEVRTPMSMATLNMHLGSTYAEAGQLQLAITRLEKAVQTLESLDVPGRLAESRMRLSQVYLNLNRPEQAKIQLEKALQYYGKNQSPAYLSTIYGRLAEAFFQLGDNQSTRVYLEEALKLAEKYQLRPQLALSRWILGEFLITIGQPEEGLEELVIASGEFQEMGTFFEQVGCQVAIGTGQLKLSQDDAAEYTWRQALEMNQGTLDAIIWQSQVGLAQLAEKRGDQITALAHYREMVNALDRQRRDFWQPVLAGQFLHKPAGVLNRAVAGAVNGRSWEDALVFIETSKAQTLVRRLVQPIQLSEPVITSPETKAAIIEIQSLNELVEAGFRAGFSQWAEAARLNKKRQEKISLLGEKYDSLERQYQSINSPLTMISRFDITQFRDLARTHLKSEWVALDYYLTDTHLYGMMLTAETSYLWEVEYSEDIKAALDICLMAKNREFKPNPAALSALGEWLLPKRVVKELGPNSCLLISPHHILHQIPWPAIRVGANSPLVACCIPVIIPSFHVVVLLWQRDVTDMMNRDGILLGINEFPDRSKQRLPQTWREVNEIARRLGPKSRILINQEATWRNLTQIASQEKGLNYFSFCHIASHASYDSITGRLSSLSLYDGDVLADQLMDCAPWPQLVTMAACNSAQSLVYEGDEHISLATALLAAKAQTVIGSLWPVRDEDAADLFIDFYEHFLAEKTPSEALALAQRKAWEQGAAAIHWSSFLCLGCP